jgi:hypothetical protein
VPSGGLPGSPGRFPGRGPLRSSPGGHRGRCRGWPPLLRSRPGRHWPRHRRPLRCCKAYPQLYGVLLARYRRVRPGGECLRGSLRPGSALII